MVTDIGSIVGEALQTVVNAIVGFFAGILDAMLAPIKTALAGFGVGVGATGVLAPLVLVLVLGASLYLIWFFWWAKGFLPDS